MIFVALIMIMAYGISIFEIVYFMRWYCKLIVTVVSISSVEKVVYVLNSVIYKQSV